MTPRKPRRLTAQATKQGTAHNSAQTKVQGSASRKANQPGSAKCRTIRHTEQNLAPDQSVQTAG